MYVYFKREEDAPMRLDVSSPLVLKYQEEGWVAASFAEWWESLGEEGQKHQLDLLEAKSEAALDETEQNFLRELEEKKAEEAPAEEAEEAPAEEAEEAPAE